MYSDHSEAKRRKWFQFNNGKTTSFFSVGKIETMHVRLFTLFAKLMILRNMYQNTKIWYLEVFCSLFMGKHIH